MGSIASTIVNFENKNKQRATSSALFVVHFFVSYFSKATIVYFGAHDIHN